MKFFIDTADLAEIRDLAETGLLDGVTTNPSLVAKSGQNFIELIKEICQIVPGPVSAEVAAIDFETMLEEGRYLATLAPNIAVKVPLTPAGLKVCNILSSGGTMVNVPCAFPRHRRCWPPRPAPASSRRSSAGWTILGRMGWS